MQLVNQTSEVNLRLSGEVPDGTIPPPARIAGPAPIVAALDHQPGRHDESSPQPVFARERTRKLLQIFGGIDRRVKNGWPIARAIRAAARRWRGRTFKSCPGRRVNFSAQTLSRLYYAFKKAGGDASVLDLHYKATPKKTCPELGMLVFEHCLGSDVASMAAAIKVLNAAGATAAHSTTLRRSVPADRRETLREVFKARAAASRAEKKARAILRRDAGR